MIQDETLVDIRARIQIEKESEAFIEVRIKRGLEYWLSLTYMQRRHLIINSIEDSLIVGWEEVYPPKDNA